MRSITYRACWFTISCLTVHFWCLSGQQLFQHFSFLEKILSMSPLVSKLYLTTVHPMESLLWYAFILNHCIIVFFWNILDNIGFLLKKHLVMRGIAYVSYKHYEIPSLLQRGILNLKMTSLWVHKSCVGSQLWTEYPFWLHGL